MLFYGIDTLIKLTLLSVHQYRGILSSLGILLEHHKIFHPHQLNVYLICTLCDAAKSRHIKIRVKRCR